jgi:hypothetical protein
MLSRNLSPPRLSLVAVAVPYGWVKVYVVLGASPLPTMLMRPKVICWPAWGVPDPNAASRLRRSLISELGSPGSGPGSASATQ